MDDENKSFTVIPVWLIFWWSLVIWHGILVTPYLLIPPGAIMLLIVFEDDETYFFHSYPCLIIFCWKVCDLTFIFSFFILLLTAFYFIVAIWTFFLFIQGSFFEGDETNIFHSYPCLINLCWIVCDLTHFIWHQSAAYFWALCVDCLHNYRASSIVNVYK